MFCNKCGNNLGEVDGIRFCNKCGNDLSASIASMNKPVEEPQPQVINTVVEEPKVDLEKRKSNKKKLWITAVVCCLLWIVIVIGGFVLLFGAIGALVNDYGYDSDYDYEYDYDYDYNYDTEEDQDADLTWGNDEEETTNEDDEDTTTVVDENRVGSDTQGYVTVPDDWEEKDSGYDGMLQYLNATEGSVTLYSVNSSLLSAKAYADNVEDTMPSQGINEVNRKEVELAGYDAYKLWGYSDTAKIWLTVWIFEAEDDRTHYLAIETLGEYSNELKIADTFSLEK